MPLVEDFFRELDHLWSSEGEGKILLRVIGCTALMLQTNYERGTKDSDVIETTAITDDVKARLLALADKGTPLHQRRNLYIDVVAQGLPFLPLVPRVHRLDQLSSELRHFDIEVLDVVDVVVSKLKRFNANDISDIEAMVDQDRVGHADLLTRFRSAVDAFSCDARAEDLPKYVKHLNRVERDMLVVPESTIELPSWIAD